MIRAGLAVLAILAVCTAGLVSAGNASATTGWNDITIYASDATPLACAYLIPNGTPPAGGWPGVMLFHGLGKSYVDMEGDGNTLAQAGFASLACDARGTGSSGGKFGLDGPNEAQDALDLFNWFAAQDEVSNTEIGAFGLSMGGGAVWDAVMAGVPFKAIVPGVTWTRLAAGLNPNDIPKVGFLSRLFPRVPYSRWDSSLAQVRQDLLSGSVTDTVKNAEVARSVRSHLQSITVPTLLIQGRHDFLFDMDQAFAAYRQLAGPKRLYLGDLGHVPATNPAGDHAAYLNEAVNWFRAYLAGGPKVGGGVDLAHDPWDGRITHFPSIPRTRHVSVNLPGTSTLTSSNTYATRSVRLPEGPLETFGAGSITVNYSTNAVGSSWARLLATVSVKGAKNPVTLGGVPLTADAGVLHIPLSNEADLLPLGTQIVVTIGPGAGHRVYGDVPAAPDGGSITIHGLTLNLSVLERAVSK